MTVALDLINLYFWQGPADGWEHPFELDSLPSKIGFICDCYQLKKLRFAVYKLNLAKRRYEYIGSSRVIQESVTVRESLVTKAFYIDKAKNVILHEWVPISSTKGGL